MPRLDEERERPTEPEPVCGSGAVDTPSATELGEHLRTAYSGEAGHPFRTKPITDSGKPITDSGQADHLRDDAGVLYFAAFLAVVKLSAFRMDSPPSLRRWALWTSLSQMASARVASPMTACQSLGSSWLVRTVEPSW